MATKDMMEHMKRIREKKCPNCGKDLVPVEGSEHIFKFGCECFPKYMQLSFG